jgi:tetratricopeptide (TPR) repeat protein
MGVVYFCYDQQLREPIAVKTYRDVPVDAVPGALAEGSRSLAHLFESEALLWVRLGRHPHIVQARYVLRLGGKPYVFLEYVPGPAGEESTVRRLLRPGRRDLATALDIAIQVCAGMEHATTTFSGLVHRDLKPENLLLTTDGLVKITDFGLTRVFADVSDRVGAFAGTPPYMSPEQMLGLPHLDTRSDIFALGVILYELLTGRIPTYEGATTQAAFRARLADDPRAPSEIEALIPDGVSQLIMRCLRRQPEARFPSFRALGEALATCYRAATGRPPRETPVVGAQDAAQSPEADVALARAVSLAALGRHDEALVLVDLAVEQAPEYAAAWAYKGVALTGLARLDEAIGCFDRALAIDPRDVDVWLNKGRALAGLGRRDEALDCFDLALTVNPWHTATLYEKGASLLLLGRNTEAHACFTEVSRVVPGLAVGAALQASTPALNGVAPSVDLEREPVYAPSVDDPDVPPAGGPPPLGEKPWTVT